MFYNITARVCHRSTEILVLSAIRFSVRHITSLTGYNLHNEGT